MNSKLLAFLQEHAYGKEHSVTSRTIQDAFKMRGSEVRDAVNKLRCSGFPVCSGPSGYYYARTQREIYNSVNQLLGRATAITAAAKGMMRCLTD